MLAEPKLGCESVNKRKTFASTQTKPTTTIVITTKCHMFRFYVVYLQSELQTNRATTTRAPSHLLLRFLWAACCEWRLTILLAFNSK